MRRSVLSWSAMAFATLAVCLAVICGNLANAQARQAQPESLPVVREFNQHVLESLSRTTVARFDLGRTSSNPDGTPISQWTAADFFKFSSDELFGIRAMFIDERYDLIDQIKPTSMNREQFSRAILRESARRGIIDNPYETRFSGLPTNEVTVMRPLGVSRELQRQVTASPLTLTLFDTAAIIVTNPRIGAIQIERDVAREMGRPDLALNGLSIANDAATYDLGYTVGALSEFRRGRALERTLGFVQPPEVLQQAFCPLVGEIFRQPGRTLDQTEAFAAGFLQARIDTRTNFQGTDIPVGMLAACPSVARVHTTQDRLNFAIMR